jgi:hypothetical protein
MANTPPATPAAPPRAPFRIHGFTVLALLVVAGVLIWANVRPHIPANNTHFDYLMVDMHFGWPIRCASYLGPGNSNHNRVVYGFEYYTFEWNYVAANAFIGFVILAITALLCEGPSHFFSSKKAESAA